MASSSQQPELINIINLESADLPSPQWRDYVDDICDEDSKEIDLLIRAVDTLTMREQSLSDLNNTSGTRFQNLIGIKQAIIMKNVDIVRAKAAAEEFENKKFEELQRIRKVLGWSHQVKRICTEVDIEMEMFKENIIKIEKEIQSLKQKYNLELAQYNAILEEVKKHL